MIFSLLVSLSPESFDLYRYRQVSWLSEVFTPSHLQTDSGI